MAGMTRYKPGERSRLFYSLREYTGRKDQLKRFGFRCNPERLTAERRFGQSSRADRANFCFSRDI
jgi:hypothetical protein